MWTTDKDGLLLGLLAAEITAVTGKDPGRALRGADGAVRRAGLHADRRAVHARRRRRGSSASRRTPSRATTLAGDPITAKLTNAPGNGAPIGGLKVTTAQGWFAARPCGTENVYKLYAESFRDAGHLARIVAEAREMVGRVLSA